MSGGKLADPRLPLLSERAHMSDAHLQLLLEQFAEHIDSAIQGELFSELMVRYADTSARLEETVTRLRQSDAARVQAQRIARLGNWAVELSTGKITWSETMYAITELPPDTEPSLDIFGKLVHPEDRERIVKAGHKVLTAGEGDSHQRYRLQMPDGRVKWVEVQLARAQSDGPQASEVYGTMQDVTESTLTEMKLKEYNDSLETLVQQKAREVISSQEATIRALVKLAESRDDDTGEHIERMSRYCRFVAETLRKGGPYAAQVDEAFARDIAMASPLHDIGKVGVPDGILLKPGRLTPDEFKIMRTHVTIGYETLASVVKSYPGNAYLKMGMDIARYHHEMWDGSGYQSGLAGEAIPLSARILALCDVYDALRSRRVYKEPYTHERSREIVLAGRGSHFDPVLTDLFAQHHTTFEQIFDSSARG